MCVASKGPRETPIQNKFQELQAEEEDSEDSEGMASSDGGEDDKEGDKESSDDDDDDRGFPGFSLQELYDKARERKQLRQTRKDE